MASNHQSPTPATPPATASARLSFKPARLLLATAAALGVLSSAACGPITPVSPTWKDDVRPLLVSRCMRCHDGSGKGDKSVTGSTAGSIAFNFNVPPDLPSPLPQGLMSLQMYLQPTNQDVVRGTKVLRRMPPPPLEALEDWQIETLEAWAASPR